MSNKFHFIEYSNCLQIYEGNEIKNKAILNSFNYDITLSMMDINYVILLLLPKISQTVCKDDPDFTHTILEFEIILPYNYEVSLALMYAFKYWQFNASKCIYRGYANDISCKMTENTLNIKLAVNYELNRRKDE